jgi:hypothetical protein
MGSIRRIWCGNRSNKTVRNMYDESKACVRVNGMLSEWFEVKQGVRQGCVMSP